MDQDETWHMELGPGHIVLHGDPAPLPKGAQPPVFAHVCCGQTAGWIKMPLGTEVGLGPGDIVLDEGTQLPLKRSLAPTFRLTSIVANLATIHRRYRQDRTRQRFDSIGQTVTCNSGPKPSSKLFLGPQCQLVNSMIILHWLIELRFHVPVDTTSAQQ